MTSINQQSLKGAGEDVLTTGNTAAKTIAEVERAGGTLTNHLCAIANRSGSGQLNGREIAALIKPKCNVGEPAACPLCQAGFQAIRPKGNWARLTPVKS